MMEYEQASYRFYRAVTFSLLNNKLTKTEALELISRTHNRTKARLKSAVVLEEKFFEVKK
jgi:hypothetical protein